MTKRPAKVLRKAALTSFSAEVLADIRSVIPDINDTYDEYPRKAAGHWSDALHTINRMQHEMIIEGYETDIEANWQLGRLMHNMGKTSDSFYYLGKAQELVETSLRQTQDPELAALSLKITGRTIEAHLDMHKDIPNGEHLKEACILLLFLQDEEDTPYSRRLFNRAKEAYYDFNQTRPQAAPGAQILTLPFSTLER